MRCMQRCLSALPMLHGQDEQRPSMLLFLFCAFHSLRCNNTECPGPAVSWQCFDTALGLPPKLFTSDTSHRPCRAVGDARVEMPVTWSHRASRASSPPLYVPNRENRPTLWIVPASATGFIRIFAANKSPPPSGIQ